MSAAITGRSEIDPSTGYLLNDTVYPVGGSAKLYGGFNTTENTLPETVKKAISSLSSMWTSPVDVSEDENGDGETSGMVERPEAGAVFEIYLKRVGSYENAKESERDRITTDQNGFAASKDLPYGRYTVHQVSGEEGKAFVPDFTVFISEDGKTYSYILNNTTITARIKVEKRDAETGNIIPLPGT
ncbi:MAG: collagen binding domain-containing protein, partial [Butyricicoccus sp.]